MITYQTGIIPETDEIINLYVNASVNRPVYEKMRIKEMYEYSNLVVTAWHYDKLIGISRSVTDFLCRCYLYDLAVNKEYKSTGIENQLIALIKKTIGNNTLIIFHIGPDAMEGINLIEGNWVLQEI